jgi:hypothetical protein
MEFLTYKRFSEQNRVEAITQILKENGIAVETTEDSASLDSLYGDKQFSRQFYIKIGENDFLKADAILAKVSEQELDTVDKDHYLYSFTDEELFDILSKPDEWNELDYQLSKKILKERGKEINNDIIELLRNQRVKELAKPEESQRVWIYAGYLFALLGGFLGIFVGWHLSSHKKTLPNGQRVFAYSLSDRKDGNRILIIGIVMFIITTIIRIVAIDN